MPSHIGEYRISRVLGRGGMGTVFLATDPSATPPGLVAVKVLHRHLGVDPESRLEFVAEARLAVQIDHPNVVQVKELGEDQAGLFIAMEFVAGITFQSLLRAFAAGTERPDTRVVLRILDDVLRGLHAAHEMRDERGEPAQLVHRDVSPPNILIGLDGWTRVTDFGIAKALNRQSYTEQGTIKGRTGYIAPEQITSVVLDRRCDLWGVGVLAWEALTGQRLFKGDEFEAMRKAVEEEAPSLALHRPDLPLVLSDAIAQALARRPQNRFTSAEAMRLALLGAWGEGLAERAEVAQLSEKLSRQFEREQSSGRQEIAATETSLQAKTQVTRTNSAHETHVAEPTKAAVTPMQVDEPIRAAARTSRARPPVMSPRELNQTQQPRSSRLRSIRYRPLLLTTAVLGVAGLITLGVRAAATRTSQPLPRPNGDEKAQPGPSSEHAKPAAEPVGEKSVGSQASLPADKGIFGSSDEDRVASRAQRRSLSVTSNVKLTQVKLGDRIIAPAAPAKQLSIELLENERSKRLRVEGFTREGRHAGAWLPAGVSAVHLVLPQAPAQLARPRPTVGRSPEPALPAPTPLADNPYQEPH